MSDKPASAKADNDVRQTVVEKTGFEPNDLLAAPVKPPELKNTRPHPKPEQLWLILLGFVVAVVGLVVLLITSSFIGVVLAAIGALAIALATLVRI